MPKIKAVVNVGICIIHLAYIYLVYMCLAYTYLVYISYIATAVH